MGGHLVTLLAFIWEETFRPFRKRLFSGMMDQALSPLRESFLHCIIKNIEMIIEQ